MQKIHVNLKDLTLDDMKYIDAMLAEQYGHHAMIYHPADRFCWLATPIHLPHGRGDLVAIGMLEKNENLIFKIQKDTEDIEI